MTIIEGNKLIAEFMGWKKKRGFEYLWVQNHQKENGIVENNFKYHSSWDWLMLVVEKIAILGYRVKTNFNQVDNSVIIQSMDGEEGMSSMYYSKPIEAVYTAVTQFIQWYNSQTKNIEK